MKLTTFKELGQKLPVGRPGQGKLLKDFTLRPYKSRIDRQLNIWREANEQKSMAHMVAKFLSMIVEQAGGESFVVSDDGNSPAESVIKFHNWWFADVMYIYVYSRISSVGEVIELPFSCPQCRKTGYLKADLWDTEVRHYEENETDLESWIVLKEGVRLKSGKTARKIKIRPATFNALLIQGSMKESVNSLGYNQMREMICGVDCENGFYSISNEEIDDISKIDQLNIDRQANKISAGPDLRTKITCSNKDCGVTVRNALDWSFDHFFDSSVPLSTTSI